MFQAMKIKTHYSACITASHNPADYNGIKIFIKGERDADEIITVKIKSQVNL